MRRTRLIVPAVLAVLALLAALAGTAAAARPRHEADHDQEAQPQEGQGDGRDDRGRDGRDGHAETSTTAASRSSRTASSTRHGFTQAVSKADRVLLAHQMELAARDRAAVPDRRRRRGRRPAPRRSVLAGARRALHRLRATASAAADGVMTDDAIRQPLAWIYDGTHPDSHVVGLFYGIGGQGPGGLRGTERRVARAPRRLHQAVGRRASTRRSAPTTTRPRSSATPSVAT